MRGEVSEGSQNEQMAKLHYTNQREEQIELIDPHQNGSLSLSLCSEQMLIVRHRAQSATRLCQVPASMALCSLLRKDFARVHPKVAINNCKVQYFLST